MNTKVDFPAGCAPLNDELLDTVQRFDSKALYWLSGYCSGLADSKNSLTKAKTPIAEVAQAGENLSETTLKTALLYASQTGNSQALAHTLFENLSQKGIDAELLDIADLKPSQIGQYQLLIVLTSTHGEGEPPDDAIELIDYINSKRAPKLDGVKHAIVGLGDSSYEFFCQTGKDFEQALFRLGSKSLIERLDCDVDYQASFDKWTMRLIDALEDLAEQSARESLLADGVAEQFSGLSNCNVPAVYSKNNPLQATVLANQSITARGSVKQVHHLELSLVESGLTYQPGDSLGVFCRNSPPVVQQILQLMDLSGDEIVSLKQQQKTLQRALTQDLEISLINRDFVRNYALLFDSVELNQIAETGFTNYVINHQVVDLLITWPKKLEAQQLVDLLKPIKPRMYSIASSLQANPQEVHLTVALEKSQNEHATRYGSASHYLIERLKEDDEVMVFVEHNKHFKLPQDDKPIIMVGPGTGVAPFRSFLQQREINNTSSDNWLFFGNPNFNTDFLYQLEWQKYIKSGLLTHLSVAFSRDQTQKIYVQHRLLENATELWQWIHYKQAVIYVCGDMTRMAKDVNSALLQIIVEQGCMNQVEAEAYLKSLKKSNRYQRDIY